MSAPAPTTSPIQRAFILAALLFVLFLIVTGLYARYGYAFALCVYEQQQLANIERRNGSGKLIEFEDYLRVDPTNLYMRGLFINMLIEMKNPWRGLDVATEGVAAVPPDQQPIAKLLLARAQIARGKLEDAEATYRDVLEALPLDGSGEAHYGLAYIAAARGDFERMTAEFTTYDSTNAVNSTPDFTRRAFDASLIAESFFPEPYAYTEDAINVSFALPKIQLGWIENGLSILAEVKDLAGAPPIALFLRGVYEEEQGRRDVALDFYKRAAIAGDALGKFAAERLDPPPAEAEAETEK